MDVNLHEPFFFRLGVEENIFRFVIKLCVLRLILFPLQFINNMTINPFFSSSQLSKICL